MLSSLGGRRRRPRESDENCVTETTAEKKKKKKKKEKKKMKKKKGQREILLGRVRVADLDGRNTDSSFERPWPRGTIQIIQSHVHLTRVR